MPLTNPAIFNFKEVYNLVDEPLVNGVWSSSFQHIGGLKLLAIMLLQENDEVADKDLNLRMIIDGVEYNSAAPITFVDGVPQWLSFTSDNDVIQNNAALVLPYFDGVTQLPLECSSLHFLVGLDSVAGTNQRYSLLIRWFGAS